LPALVGLTRTMCKEWGRYKVNVNCIAFGLINTRLTQPIEAQQKTIDVAGRDIKVGVQPQMLDTMARMIPLGRGGTPEEAADAVYLFCSPESNYISGQVVVCGRRKDLIIMGGRNIYPTDIERAASTADGVRAGNAVAVRLAAGEAQHRESFAVVVESRKAGDPDAERGIGKDVTSRVVSAVGVRPARVVVLAPGSLPKTPSGKLRRAATAELLRG
jgi:hypothetical protein